MAFDGNKSGDTHTFDQAELSPSSVDPMAMISPTRAGTNMDQHRSTSKSHPRSSKIPLEVPSLVDESTNFSPKRVRIVIKAAQKIEIANYLLSACHEFSTGLTTALTIGGGATKCSPFYHNLSELFEDCNPGSLSARQSSQLNALLEDLAGCCRRPMTLPVALLQHYATRSRAFSTYVSQNIFELEHDVGLAFSNQTGAIKSHDRAQLYRFTATTHSTMVQIHFAMHAYHWATSCGRFLTKLHYNIIQHIPADDTNSRQQLERTSTELEDALRHMASSMDCVRDFLSLLERACTVPARRRKSCHTISLPHSVLTNIRSTLSSRNTTHKFPPQSALTPAATAPP